MINLLRQVSFALSLAFAASSGAKTGRTQSQQTPLLITHYMPWYASKKISGKWGWHWTMNHFNPDDKSAARQLAASKYRPLIGLYDSSDPDVLEYHVLLMKLAGLDGVAIDWYGIENYYDYANINHNAQLLVNELKKAGLKYTLVYEDQTVTQELKGNLFGPDQAVEKGAEAFKWLSSGWFQSPNFIRFEDKPVLMVFGPQYFKDDEWSRVFEGLNPQPAFFTLMFKKGPAIGGFSWPTPQRGEAKSWDELTMFDERAKDWPAHIGVAYPRFDDIYKEAGLSGFPVIQDDNGETFKKTMDIALASNPIIVQVATWNDWGEGTQIEPSQEFEYRDLETLQTYRKKLDPSFAFTAQDLRLPYELYELRKKFHKDPPVEGRLDEASKDLCSGRPELASALLRTVISIR